MAVYDGNGRSSIGEQIANERDLVDLPYWAAPGAPAVTTGGSVPAGIYSVRAAYTYAGGVGILSPSTMVTVGSGQQFLGAFSPRRTRRGWRRDGMSMLGHRGTRPCQNTSPLAIGSGFTLSAAPTTNLGILPLGCSAFCHPLYRFQFLGGPSYSGAGAGIGLQQWNAASSTWQSQFSVNGNGSLTAAGSGSFGAGVSVSGGATVTGGTTTDALTITGGVTASNVTTSGNIGTGTLTSGVVTSGQINKIFYADGYPAAGCTVGATVTTTQLDCAAGERGRMDHGEQCRGEVNPGFGHLLHLPGNHAAIVEWIFRDAVDPGGEPGADDHLAELRHQQSGDLSR